MGKDSKVKIICKIFKNRGYLMQSLDTILSLRKKNQIMAIHKKNPLP